ncbi:hypothetical protein BaRGS_00021184, partial [Batillaria attramentaria]
MITNHYFREKLRSQNLKYISENDARKGEKFAAVHRKTYTGSHLSTLRASSQCLTGIYSKSELTPMLALKYMIDCFYRLWFLPDSVYFEVYVW